MHNLVPHFILEQYQADNHNGQLQACALFLDISGFTAMTQSLMKHGKEGAEILARIINQIFDPVIQAVYDGGGFVTGFAGDAFTAVFPSQDTVTALSVCRAALTIQQIFQEYGIQDTQYGTFSLAVKQGVSSGQVDWGIVGPDGHKTWFFRGSAIDSCAYAEHQASGGDIVLDEAVQSLLSPAIANISMISANYGRLLGLDVPKTSHYSRSLSPEPQLLASDFFPESLWLMSQQGEFRQVTTVFISFQGGEIQSDLNTFVRHVMDTAVRFGGYFNKLDFGDKGGTMLVCFGAPIAHENIQERALNFALMLETDSKQLQSLTYRLGITSGIVYAGFVGGGLRDEYTALGSVVNLSARLMMQAKWGQVLVDPAIAQQSGFTFTHLGDWSYKGFTQPVATYQLQAAKTDSDRLFDQQMVGRENELQQLIDFVQPLFEGKLAGTAIVYGEAGIGKSHLVYTLQQALGKKATWFIGQTDQILRQAWNPFTYWLQRYFKQSPQMTTEQNKAAFEQKRDTLIIQLTQAGERLAPLAAELQRISSFLGALLGLHWPDSLYEQLDAKLRRENTLTAVKTLLLAESQLRPVVFELEDGHWLDEASHEMLTNLSRHIADYPLLILITSRYADDGSKPGFDLADDVPIFSLDLSALSAKMLQQQATNILGSPVDDNLLDLLQEKTQGNPFFVQQLLTYLKENDLLEQQPDKTWAAKVLAFDVPSTINVILMARIDRLTQEIKTVVQTAAVLGREFAVQVLSYMLKQDTLPQVQQAEQLQIWALLTELRYLFKHALLRDIAYEMQLRTRLRELHKLAAETMSSIYHTDLTPHYSNIAYHYETAYHQGLLELQEQAITTLWQSGIQATKTFNHPMAIDYFSRALTILPPGDNQRRYKILLAREDAYHLAGDREAQSQDLDTLTSLSVARQNPEEQAQVILRQARMTEAICDFEQTIEFAQNIIPLAQLAGNLNMESKAQIKWGMALWHQGEYPPSHKHLTRALKLAQAGNHQQIEAECLLCLGFTASRQGEHDSAQDYIRQAFILAERIGDQKLMQGCLKHLGNLGWSQGDYIAAKDYYQQSLLIAEAIGDRRAIASCLSNLGLVSLHRVNCTDAQDYYQQALSIFKAVGDQIGVSINLSNLGILAWTQGQYAAAQDFYHQALAIAEVIGNKWGATIGLNNLGVVEMEMGSYELAHSHLQQALSLAQEIGYRNGEGETLNNLGALALFQGHLGAARDYYQSALNIRTELAQSHYLVEDYAGLALATLRQKDKGTAHKHIQQVLTYLQHNPKLNETENPIRTFHFTWQVCQELRLPQTKEVLAFAAQVLQIYLDNQADPAAQATYLAQPHHKVLWQVWQEQKEGVS